MLVLEVPAGRPAPDVAGPDPGESARSTVIGPAGADTAVAMPIASNGDRRGVPVPGTVPPGGAGAVAGGAAGRGGGRAGAPGPGRGRRR
ncbi:hypothetical protein AB0K89_26545, partial [Streptomyces cinnamoneus]